MSDIYTTNRSDLTQEEMEGLQVAVQTLFDGNTLFAEGYNHLVFALKVATAQLEKDPDKPVAMLLEIVQDKQGKFGVRFIVPEG